MLAIGLHLITLSHCDIPENIPERSHHCFSHSLPEFATLTLWRLAIFDLIDLICNLIVATVRELVVYRAHVGCMFLVTSQK